MSDRAEPCPRCGKVGSHAVTCSGTTHTMSLAPPTAPGRCTELDLKRWEELRMSIPDDGFYHSKDICELLDGIEEKYPLAEIPAAPGELRKALEKIESLANDSGPHYPQVSSALAQVLKVARTALTQAPTDG